MELKDLIGIYQEQVALIDRIWWYYYSVTFVVLGFTIGSNQATNSYLEVAIICLGYAAFAYGSSQSLCHAQSDLNSFAKLVVNHEDGFQLSPLPSERVVLFHTIISGLVVLGVLITFAVRKWFKT